MNWSSLEKWFSPRVFLTTTSCNKQAMVPREVTTPTQIITFLSNIAVIFWKSRMKRILIILLMVNIMRKDTVATLAA